jgi:putative aldouronate transport system permease protein
MIENKTIGTRLRVIVIHVVVVLLALLCLFPIWNMVCMSFSSSTMVLANKVTFFPREFTLEAYKRILKDTQFFVSFGRSVLRVVLALALQLTMIVLTAYPLSKTVREFNGRNIVMTLMIVAMLFSGGMIPMYLLLKELKMINTIWALVLPSAVPISNMIMTMNFMTAIPSSLEEAAIIDGASPLQVLTRIILPCSKPSLATMALFSIVGHWNDFEGGLIYMTKREKYPLMTYIQTLTATVTDNLEDGMTPEALEKLLEVTGKNLNAAKVVVATIPLMLIYPFLQKYLIHGIVMGAVKE